MTKYGPRRRREQNRRVRSGSLEHQPYRVPYGAKEVYIPFFITAAYSIDDHHWEYRNRVVRFSIQILETDTNGQRLNCIYRIDAEEGSIHEHSCSPGGDNVGVKKIIAKIPTDGNGQVFVTEQYHVCLRKVFEKALSEYERWCALK